MAGWSEGPGSQAQGFSGSAGSPGYRNVCRECPACLRAEAQATVGANEKGGKGSDTTFQTSMKRAGEGLSSCLEAQ